MGSFTMTLDEVIDFEGRDNIGLSEYPIFDESHRKILNDKIIDHYWNQEIGMETISMFRLAMKRKMNEIMPAYNQNYELSAVQIKALSTMDVETEATNTGQTQGANSSSTVSDSDAKSRAVASDFPQNSLQANSDYATNAQDNISESKATANSTDEQNATQTGTSKSTVSGYQGHQPELIFAARQTIVNIDLEIITVLQSLFMGIWSVPSEYTSARNQYVNYYF